MKAVLLILLSLLLVGCVAPASMEKRIGIESNSVLPILDSAIIIKCHKPLTTKDVWAGTGSSLKCMTPESEYNPTRDGSIMRKIKSGTGVRFVSIHGSRAFDVYYFVEVQVLNGDMGSSVAVMSWNLEKLFGLTFKADY